MSLEYALITDSSLPNFVKESEYYVPVDKNQWIDLIDYSEGIVEKDPDQKILFLIVAKGTPEQEAKDAEKNRLEREARERAEMDRAELEKNLSEQEKREREKRRLEQEQAEEKNKLRQKSKKIFNALYNK